MFKKRQLSYAVGAALSLGASVALLPQTADAQNEEARGGESLEEVIITGSRIRTNIADTPRPVTILDKDALQLRGVTNVTSALRELTYNTLGSFRDQSGTSFGQVALVGLKGLGEDRTAVLINNRRVPGNPMTGSAAVDLNTIPMSAVDRIEVLTDSASAIYGADAIGGVINVIMRDDFNGAEISLGRDEPSRDDAYTNRMSVTLGQSTDQGHIMFSADYYKRDPIFDADRDYSKVNVMPGPDGSRPRHDVDTVGVSAGGNTAFDPAFNESFAVGDCPEGTYVRARDAFGTSGEVCGFGYANRSMQTGGLERWSTYLDATFNINDDHTLYLEGRTTKSDTFGRYAPAVGFVSVPASLFDEELSDEKLSAYQYDRNDDGMIDHQDVNFEDWMHLDMDTEGMDGYGELSAAEFGTNNPRDYNGDGVVDVADEQSASLFHRFVGHGNRDDNVAINEIDTVMGLRGTLSLNFGGGGGPREVNYDVFVRHYEYNADEEGDTYVITNLIQNEIREGDYDFRNPAAPSNQEAVQRTSATLSRDIQTEYDHAAFALDGTAWNLPAGDVAWALGGEWANEKYKDQYDNIREAGNVTGSAGNSSAGERERRAFYGEVEVPPIDDMTVNLALRYDDYDDIGSEVSPSISWRYAPVKWVTLRASWGQGFKAPNLGNVSQSLSQSSETVQDLQRCGQMGIEKDDCSASQRDEFTGGNKSLEPETSESFNLGAIFYPVDGLEVSLDWWRVDIEDAIATLGLEDVLKLETGGTLPPGVIVNRGPATGNVIGPILPCVGVVNLSGTPACGIVNVFANLATFEVEGLDLRAEYTLDTPVGEWVGKLNLSHFLRYDEQVLPGGETFKRTGRAKYPDIQANASLDWRYSDFNVNYSVRWVDGHDDGNINAAYRDWSRHDLTGTWTSNFGLEVILGIRNFMDTDPEIDRKGTGWTTTTEEISKDLYDLAGRVYTTTATWRF